jgi:hypothetical protein
MANKYMKKCSASIGKKKMQIKIPREWSRPPQVYLKYTNTKRLAEQLKS